MRWFSLSLDCLCLPLFLSLSATCSCALLLVCVSSLHTLHCRRALPFHVCTCCPVHTDQGHLLSGSLSFPLPACLLPMAHILQSFPSVSLCLLLCLGLTLSSASCASVPLYLDGSESVFLSLLSFCLSLPPAPSCSLYLQHVSICSCRCRKSTHGIYMYFFAALRCFEVI